MSSLHVFADASFELVCHRGFPSDKLDCVGFIVQFNVMAVEIMCVVDSAMTLKGCVPPFSPLCPLAWILQKPILTDVLLLDVLLEKAMSKI